MTIRHETRAAIAELPGKTLQPWKDGDPRCQCTHCELCGQLYRTVDIAQHEEECQAALLKALTPVEFIRDLLKLEKSRDTWRDLAQLRAAKLRRARERSGAKRRAKT